PAQWLRRLRHDRECVGMDSRLVVRGTRGRCAEGVLHPGEPARRGRGRQLRRVPAADQDSAQGAQGRLAPLRAELLPSLSPGCAACGADRYLDEPCRVSLRGEGGRGANVRRNRQAMRKTMRNADIADTLVPSSFSVDRVMGTMTKAH